jgi:hypothetical protein
MANPLNYSLIFRILNGALYFTDQRRCWGTFTRQEFTNLALEYFSLKPTNVIIPLKINFLNTREIGSTHSIGIDLQSANIATSHPNIKKVESSITLNNVNISLRSLNSKNIDLYLTTPSLNPIYHQ